MQALVQQDMLKSPCVELWKYVCFGCVYMCVKYFEVCVYVITCVCCRNHTCAATEKKNIIRIENMYVLNDYISVHLCVMYIHIYVYNMSVRSKQMTSACGQDHAWTELGNYVWFEAVC